MGRLSKAQSTALARLNSGNGSAYSLSVGLGTLYALQRRGLVQPVRALGDIAFPRNAVWRITDAGRRTLTQETIDGSR